MFEEFQNNINKKSITKIAFRDSKKFADFKHNFNRLLNNKWIEITALIVIFFLSFVPIFEIVSAAFQISTSEQSLNISL